MSKPGKKQKIIFLVVVGALLCIPLYLILHSESMLSDTKNIYRFKAVRLKDPYDPLRGNYLEIDFPTRVRLDSSENNNGGRTVYVLVERDSLGYAHFVMAKKEVPATSNYFTARQVNFFGKGSHVWIDVPFDKYFIKESNALLAEKVYLREVWNEKTNMYIEVSINNGESLLKDIYVDSIPLNQYMNQLTPEQRQALDTMDVTSRWRWFR